MNSQNKNNKYNARLVVKGHTKRGFNYEKKPFQLLSYLLVFT